jgi:hypothetical protein
MGCDDDSRSTGESPPAGTVFHQYWEQFSAARDWVAELDYWVSVVMVYLLVVAEMDRRPEETDQGLMPRKEDSSHVRLNVAPFYPRGRRKSSIEVILLLQDDM